MTHDNTGGDTDGDVDDFSDAGDDDVDEEMVMGSSGARWTRARVSMPDRSAEPSPHEAANSNASRIDCMVMVVLVVVLLLVASMVTSKLVCNAIIFAAARICPLSLGSNETIP